MNEENYSNSEIDDFKRKMQEMYIEYDFSSIVTNDVNDYSQRFEKIYSPMKVSKSRPVNYLKFGGPFEIFLKSFRGKYRNNKSKKNIMNAFCAWQNAPEEIRKEALELFYAKCNKKKLDYSFKGHYTKAYLEIKNIMVTPYFLWLSWYLRNQMTKKMANKSSAQLAIELGSKWNAMLNDVKLAWIELGRQKFKKHKYKKGGIPELNKLYFY